MWSPAAGLALGLRSARPDVLGCSLVVLLARPHFVFQDVFFFRVSSFGRGFSRAFVWWLLLQPPWAWGRGGGVGF